jgi:hypothetical protein
MCIQTRELKGWKLDKAATTFENVHSIFEELILEKEGILAVNEQ